MEGSQFRYTVERGSFIDKWMTSGVISAPVNMPPVPDSFPNYYPGASVKDAQGKERKSPAKQEYLRRGEFRALAYPGKLDLDKLYFPADTKRVDYSTVFPFPTDARLFARVYAECAEDTAVKLAMFCCGGMKLWVNGALAAEYYPYEANIECRRDAELKLTRGTNELLVALNDYGERNIVFRFGLKLLEGRLELSLPVRADAERIERVRRCLNGLYLDRLNYRDAPVFLCSDEGFPERMELTVSAEDVAPVSRSAEQGAQRVLLFDAEALVSGYHEFTVTAEAEGVVLKTALSAQVCPRERERRSIGMESAEERRSFCLRYAAECGSALDNYIASLECGQNEYDRFHGAVLHDLDFAERRGDCADFRVQRFLWLLARYGERLPAALRGRIEQLILGFRYWFDEPGNDAMWFFSENHALAFHSDEYLAGQLFPDAVFPNSGMTGREHQEKARARIVEWFEKLLRYGYNEWNSATYINVDVFTYITLYCLAEDPALRALAKQALDFTFETYAYNSFRGVMGTSNGRTYNKDILGNATMSGNAQMWLAWGVGCINRRVSPALYLAMSDYAPPEEYRSIALCESADRLIRERTEGTMAVRTYLCKTSDYILGTCVSPRTGGPGSQELLLSIFLNDPETRIWLNLPGEGRVFGIRRPGYFSGNALTPLVTQRENAAAVSYRFFKTFLRRCEADYVHVMCDERECDEVLLKDGALFIRRGEAYAAFLCTLPLRRSERASLRGCEFVTEGISSEWLIKVSDRSEFPDFERFTAYHLAHRPRVVGRKLYFEDVRMGRLCFPLLTKTYMLRGAGPKKLKELGVSREMVLQYLRDAIKPGR